MDENLLYRVQLTSSETSQRGFSVNVFNYRQVFSHACKIQLFYLCLAKLCNSYCIYILKESLLITGAMKGERRFDKNHEISLEEGSQFTKNSKIF